MEIFLKPWPWYIAGPLIGLTVPLLFILGNKSFGISSTLRHICAMASPKNIPFFNYDWKKETWNLIFVLGIFLGSMITVLFFRNNHALDIDFSIKFDLLTKYGILVGNDLLPSQLFSLEHVGELRFWAFTLFGGFLVGFGTRYAGGCTSGHSITGLSTLQWPSLIATICFMIGGIVSSWFIVPYLLSL
jgi:uncharacterized membrane protein YedE/YeeE